MIMWKKLIVIFIAFIGTFSVAYAYYNMEMSASTSLSGAFKLETRDGKTHMLSNGVVYLGTNAANVPYLRQNVTDKDGNITRDNDNWPKDEIPWEVIKLIDQDKNYYLLMSDDMLDAKAIKDSVDSGTVYSQTVLPPIIKNVNDNLNSLEKSIIQTSYAMATGNNEEYVFTPTPDQMNDNGSFGLKSVDRSYLKPLIGNVNDFNGSGAKYSSYWLSTNTGSTWAKWNSVYDNFDEKDPLNPTGSRGTIAGMGYPSRYLGSDQQW